MSEERTGTSPSSRETEAIIRAIREKRLKILVVDDNKQFRRSMTLYLRRLCAAIVDEASTGADAVRQLEEGNRYDVIFLDLRMPTGTGVEIYSRLKRIDEQANIIIMSAYPSGEEWQQAKALGMAQVEKPIQMEQILEILSSGGGA